MKRPDRKKRHRLTVAATVVSFVGIGLATPFVISGMSPDLSFHSAAVIAATRDSFTLTSPIALGPLSNFRLDRGTVSLVPYGPGDVLTGATAVALLTSGKAKLKVDDATVSLDLRTIVHADEDGADTFGVAPVLSALLNMQFAELALDNSDVRITRADGSVEVLSHVKLNATRQRNGRMKIAGRFDFRGRTLEVGVTLNTKSTAENVAGAPAAFPVEVSLKGDLVHLQCAGSMSVVDTPQLTADTAELSITSVRDVASWFGSDWSGGQGLGKFSAKGPLEWTPRGISFSQAHVEIDGNVAEGALALKFAQQRAGIDATLDFEALDLKPYLTPAGKQVSATPFDLAHILPRHFTDRPLMPILQDIDADLRISAGKVLASGTSFGKAAASLSLKDGVMLTDLAELEVGKSGRCTGQLSLTVSGENAQYRLKGKVDAIDIASITGTIWPHTPVSGVGEMSVDLSASGYDRSTLMQSAVGKVGLKLPASGQLGIDVKTLAATARANELQGWGGAARGQTPVDSLSAQLVLEGGRLWAEKATAKFGDATLTALGSVHLDGGLADMQIWITHPNKPEAATAPAVALKPVAGASSPPASSAPPAAPANTVEASAAEAANSGAGLRIRGPLHAPSIRYMRLSERTDAERAPPNLTGAPAISGRPGAAPPKSLAPSSTAPSKPALQLPERAAAIEPANVPLEPASAVIPEDMRPAPMPSIVAPIAPDREAALPMRDGHDEPAIPEAETAPLAAPPSAAEAAPFPSTAPVTDEPSREAAVTPVTPPAAPVAASEPAPAGPAAPSAAATEPERDAALSTGTDPAAHAPAGTPDGQPVSASPHAAEPATEPPKSSD
ncbi:MAG: AsmA family protein [Hyphomicrobiaceae bacterium]|nr:AsmA family protein [Hyphomicrobiaceae bacterium]